jgi:glycosyltransferase involved in cell wall biosynthesis
MTSAAILFDLSEFMATPLRTGIQRVCFEILSRWRGPWPLQPVQINNDGRLQLLPEQTLEAMRDFFRAGRGDREAARVRLTTLGQQPARALDTDEIRDYRAVLNPELFFALPRIGFYEGLAERMGERLFFVVHDFLPMLRPWFFAKGGILHTMPYLRLLRRLKNLAFVSEATKQDFLKRIVRRDGREGRVLAWGGDGLGVAPPEFAPSQRRITVVGSLETRKNHAAVLDAFASLWQQGVDVTLTLIGHYVHLEDRVRRQLERLRGEEQRFQWLTDQDDNAVRDCIRGSRATLFPSLGEGYGIPPLESLALGVPVIVTEGIPSIAMIEPLGQIRLSSTDSTTIQTAVRAMLDDDFARRKHEEIRRLRLPTWSEVVRQLPDWIESSQP